MPGRYQRTGAHGGLGPLALPKRPRRRPGEEARVRAFRYTFPIAWDAARYPPAWLRVPHDEKREIQPAVRDRLIARGCFAKIIDSGAAALRGRARGAIERAGGDASWVMRGQGGAAEKGTVDVIGCTPGGIFVAIECKRPALLDAEGRVLKSAGQATDEQLEWLDAAHRKGAIVGVAWSPWDVDLIWPTEPQAEEP